ncbi:hypothetical protein BH11MYX4_BH11MYX4_67560 [soil metagenome]
MGSRFTVYPWFGCSPATLEPRQGLQSEPFTARQITHFC